MLVVVWGLGISLFPDSAGNKGRFAQPTIRFPIFGINDNMLVVVWGLELRRDSHETTGGLRTQTNQAPSSKHPRPAGESDLKSLQRSQPTCGVEGGFAVAPGEQVVKATERFRMEYPPALGPTGEFLPEEQTRRVALRGVVIARSRKRFGAVDRLPERHGLVMQ